MPDPATGLTVGASVIGGAMQSDATSSAAQTQADAANTAAQAQLDMYNQTRADMTPWRNTGSAALSRLAYLMGLQPDQVTSQPVQQTSTVNQNPYSNAFQPSGGANGTQYAVSQNKNGFYILTDLSTGQKLQYAPFDSASEYGGTNGKVWILGGSDTPLASKELTNSIGNMLKPMIKKGIPLSTVTIGPNNQVSANQNLLPQAKTQQTSIAPIATPNDPSFGSLAKPFSMADFQKDPGYDFRISEGQKALERSAAARGGLLSGAAAKAMDTYSQNFASNEFQNAYSRYNNNQSNLFNRLSGLAGTGQTAATTLGSLGANAANTASNYMTSGAAATSAAQIANGANWSSGLQNLGGSVASWFRPSTDQLVASSIANNPGIF